MKNENNQSKHKIKNKINLMRLLHSQVSVKTLTNHQLHLAPAIKRLKVTEYIIGSRNAVGLYSLFFTVFLFSI